MQKILIVEDEPLYLKLLHDQLSQKGYEVFDALDGKQGFTLTKLKHPDLILLDIRMPVMDGLAMLEELRKKQWGKKIKVIILTNLEPTDKILQKVLVDKPELYLVKSDIQLSELIEQIADVLK